MSSHLPNFELSLQLGLWSILSALMLVGLAHSRHSSLSVSTHIPMRISEILLCGCVNGNSSKTNGRGDIVRLLSCCVGIRLLSRAHVEIGFPHLNISLLH